MAITQAKQPPLGLMPLIDINAVKSEFESLIKQNFTWHYSDKTGSTNSDLLHLKQPFSIAITESQSEGRGQRNNAWQASSAENLLFSIALPLKPQQNLALLPIKVGLAIKNVASSLGFADITLKWPNDIFYQGKKVGGVLIESITQNNTVLAVIGVGLNVNMAYQPNDNFIALKQSTEINRSPLLSHCLNAIYNAIEQDDSHIIQYFNEAHLFHLKAIKFKHNTQISEGICQGINQHGQLLINTQSGLETHSTGSIVMENHVIT